MKLILCFCLLLGAGPSLPAQTRGGATDSLKDELEHAINDSQRVNCLYRLGLFSQETKRDYQAALSDYLQAMALDEADHQYRKTLRDYATILNLYFYNGDYPSAMEIATRELALAESAHDSLQMAKSYNTIGYIYFRQGNINESGNYYVLYLGMSERARDSLSIADAYTSIGEVKAAGHHSAEALSSLFSAYRLYDHMKDTERLVYASYKISQVYKGMQEYDLALVFSMKTLKEMERGLPRYNEYDRASYYINAGDIYKDLSVLDEAVQMTHYGLAIARRIRHRENVEDAWHTLADIYALQHRWDSAYFYHTLYSALKDSISNDQTRRKIEEIHEHYAVDKKDKEIVLQKEQLAHQRLLRNIFVFASICLIAFILLLYNRRRLKQRADHEVELNRQRNDLFGTIIMAQDSERKRIAQDIHDTLGSMLSAAKLNLSALDDNGSPFTPEQGKRYRTGLKLLDEASVELRNIARNILPGGLSKISLPAAVKGLLDTITASSGLKINYSVYGYEERLPEAVEISIYRILLELINNVIKHSGASLLTIQMIRYPKYINIVVEDDGAGFDPKLPLGQGMGLNNIRSRVMYLKGTIDIDSKKGAGTTILIEIPSE